MTPEENAIWNMLLAMEQYCYVSPDGLTVYIAMPSGLLKLQLNYSVRGKTEAEVNQIIQDALKELTELHHKSPVTRALSFPKGILRTMTKGPAGYGRYNDNPDYIGCPRARSDMTPCIARDGSTALSDGFRGQTACLGCNVAPSVALADLRKELPEKDRGKISCAGHPKGVANRFQELVRKVTEPWTGEPDESG